MKQTSKLRIAVTLMAAAVAGAAPIQAATTFGFTFGTNSNGGFGIESFGSNTTIQIIAFKIDLTTTPGSDTFFDTSDTAPGTSSTDFSTITATGSVTANYPDPNDSDGKQVVNIGTEGFFMGESLNFTGDLDLYSNPDTTGNPLGATVSVLFHDPNTFEFSTLTGTLVANPVTINGSNYAFGVAVPEPSAALLGALGGLFLMRRRRES